MISPVQKNRNVIVGSLEPQLTPIVEYGDPFRIKMHDLFVAGCEFSFAHQRGNEKS